jgi:hypothetical protein
VKRHYRQDYYVLGEGILSGDEHGEPVCERPSTLASLRKFRFSRLGPPGTAASPGLVRALAAAMTASPDQPDSAGPAIPAGYTYLAQFVDHDLTADRTNAALGEDVTVAELLQGRSPALDLDSLYGRGPHHRDDRVFYAADGVKLKVGTTSPVPGDPLTAVARDGFDLPRTGAGATAADRRAPLVPDARNDENLAVAQTHLAFIRFHNRVVDSLAGRGLATEGQFDAARAEVVRHYQWLLRTDLLPRLVDPEILDDVFTNGRRSFEPHLSRRAARGSRYRSHKYGDRPTMPIEFSVAAYRLGHSLVRDVYQWNRIFRDGGLAPATLLLLFTFSGTSGNFTPGSGLAELDELLPADGDDVLTLPTNWIVDFRRLYDFTEAGRDDLTVPPALGSGNVTKRIDTMVVDPLARMPAGSFGGRGTGLTDDAIERNLAFRNLTRANMVRLASGQQMADFLDIDPLKPEQIIEGAGGVDLSTLEEGLRRELTENTPLWFYVLREAEVNQGRMTGVGGRIVAEVFHRALEGSDTSIVRDPIWRPQFGPDQATFRMVDLLLFAFDGNPELLNPLGD